VTLRKSKNGKSISPIEFWRGKSVFLTGHTGFKGAWLSLWLTSLGANVSGLALPAPTEPNLFTTLKLNSIMNAVEGDIRDVETLSRAMRVSKPEIVIHMAAQPLVRESYIDPISTFATNVMGTVNVLDTIRKTDSVRACVVISSDKCYLNREWDWGYREDEPMGGHDPYSASKGCTELVVESFRRSYFSTQSPAAIALGSARAGNVIGGGDWATDRLLPDVVRSVMTSTSMNVRYPDAVRPWQHVLEPLNGYLLLAQRLHTEGHHYAQPWNFGPSSDDEQRVRNVLDICKSILGDRFSWTTSNAELHEAALLRLDCTKARVHLNWKPVWHLKRAVTETLAWYDHYIREPQNMTDFSLSQITSFLREANEHDGRVTA